MSSNLTVTRGDTLSLVIGINNADGTKYELQEGDILTFSVKKTTKIDAPILIQKTMNLQTGTICELTPDDTNLPYGKYKYDVELRQASGTVVTIIKPSTLVITEEVTTHE